MTTEDLYDAALKALIAKIESQLGWGSGLEWSTREFEQLSDRIHQHTGVQLSVVTLKRVWKRIDYAGKPTTTTLNALAEFTGAQNWQQFKQQWTGINRTASPETSFSPDQVSVGSDQRTNIRTGALVATISFCALALVFYVTAFRPFSSSRGKTYSFSSKKVVDTGVPNTVIFDYDASACDDNDSVMIQQSWDVRLAKSVNPKMKQFTSIYYHPGFFDARLKVNGEVVKKHNLLIKSNGWLPLLDTQPLPIYFKTRDVLQAGRLSLPVERIKNTGIALQPEAPWCNYYHVGDLPQIKTDDFVFEARVRNDFGEGAAACRYTELHILFEGAAMVIPLSAPGCVSTLDFYDKSGKVSDLSALGVDLEHWVDVKFQVLDSAAQVFINDEKAFDLNVTMKPVAWIGMVFKFRGTGSVDFIRVSRKNGEVVYQESFGDAPPASGKNLSLGDSY